MMTLLRPKDLVIVVGRGGPVFGHSRNAVTIVKVVLLRLASRIEVRPLAVAADSNCMSPMGSKTVGGGVILTFRQHDEVEARISPHYGEATYRDAVIPDGHIVLLPTVAYVELLGRGDDLVKMTDDGFTLAARHPDNLRHESWTEKVLFPAVEGGGAHVGMSGGPGGAPAGGPGPSGALGLHVGRMESGQALEIALHGRGQ